MPIFLEVLKACLATKEKACLATKEDLPCNTLNNLINASLEFIAIIPIFKTIIIFYGEIT
jgi:hypothetical protein